MTKPGSLWYFDSHPLAEDDCNFYFLYIVRFYFDSHPLAEDDKKEPERICYICDFDSHPLAEDDMESSNSSALMFISTHIPSQRMTYPALLSPQVWKYFDSHPLAEDDASSGVNCSPYSISTHIPSQRMTEGLGFVGQTLAGFRLTSPRRG